MDKKHPENLHRDYDPLWVVDRTKSTLVRGAIVLLRFRKVRNLTTLERLLSFILIRKIKDIYFWLPYKNVIDASNKYSVIGPSRRDPYANQWFEIRDTCSIYKQGLNEFVFKQHQLTQLEKRIRITAIFLTSELLPLTRKKVIKVLDEFMFKKQSTTKSKS
jgi:hypothetical protein